MNITRLVQGVVAVAFSMTEDIQEDGTYTQTASAVYNTESGEVAATLTTKTITAAIIKAYKEDEIDGKIVIMGDEKVLIRASELTAVTPSMADYFTNAAGIRRDVVGFTLEPTGTLYTFQMRKLGR